MKNSVEFKVRGRMALFTDPLSRIGGEKCSYHIPTYEALKGVLKSVYWKPTFVWVIDKVRVMKQIQTQTRNVKPLKYGGGNDLSIYTYLADVEYQVKAHFEWNELRTDLIQDRISGKHYSIAQRMIDKGGRRDVCLGTRECQAYVEPCVFGEGVGAYDNIPEIGYGVMFHGFDYPDETAKILEEKSSAVDLFSVETASMNNELWTRFWSPVLRNGVVDFIRPDECLIRKFVREMIPNPPKSIGLEEGAIKDELDR